MPGSDVQTPSSEERADEQRHEILPTLFGDGYGLYEVRKGSFVASFLLNCTALAVLIGLASWTAVHVPEVKQAVLSVDLTPYIMPAAKDVLSGGGGGGSREKTLPRKGPPPKAAPIQLAPPAVVLPAEQPKLAVTPTVVMPPQVQIPQTGPVGDPMSALVSGIPSNGPGFGGGIGTGSGGGVGSGKGPGVGPGEGGGMGGGVYHVGGGVTAPRILHRVEPEFSEEARKNKWQGVVLLRVIIGADGLPKNITVQRSLGMGLDEKAVEAVKQWRFKPGTREGKPVPVVVSMEVSFRLY
jgi:protein TonB